MDDYHENECKIVPAIIKVVDVENDPRWDAFVAAHPQASIYHHSAWIKVIARSYNYKPVFIALENTDTNRFEGVIPFLLVESRLTGKRLVSLPYTAYCEKLMPESQILPVIRFASQLYSDLDYLELRFLDDLALSDNGVSKQSNYVTHILDLGATLDRLYASFHSTSVRQRIKRAEKSGLHFRIAEEESALKQFYELETLVRKKHGLPPHPYRFFENLWKILKPAGRFFLAVLESQKKIIAAAVVLKSNNGFHLEYSAADQSQLKLSPNQMLIWEIIKIAHQSGARYLDFGRTSRSNPSLIEFKERWGARIRPLAYCYFPSFRKSTARDSLPQRVLHAINRVLPAALLELEGKILFPHLG
jgi:lipid II:glycine glycyltransferase (peptidoglycan interpeptide bridge formation enzyme)